MGLRPIPVLGVLSALLLSVSPAKGGDSLARTCGAKEYSYAGLQSSTRAAGIAATLLPIETPSVVRGHVGGWIGVGGTGAGPGGTPEWLQVGLSALASDTGSRIYYEVAVPGSDPRYVELDSNVRAGERHRFAVLEMAARHSWWRIWVDGKAVSPALRLPGSHGAWYPQAVAESWNGGVEACNGFACRFSNVELARDAGGFWKPLNGGHSFHDAGYRVVETSRVPRSFLVKSAF